MYEKMQIFDLIRRKKVIAIIRGIYGDECLNLAKALLQGGISVMEVTFDQSSKEMCRQTVHAISLLKDALEDNVVVGAGTVLEPDQVSDAALAGASIIVSPDTNPAVIHATNNKGMVSVPGAFSPTEIIQAHRNGADFVKVFPASLMGAGYIKAIRSPINHIPLLAVGGVSEENILSFLKAGCAGAGLGGKLVDKELVHAGKWEELSKRAAHLISLIEGEEL